MLFYLGLLVIFWFYRQTSIKLLTPCKKPNFKVKKSKKISIVSFNIQKFPWKTKSLAPLSKLLKKYDIILLQECFDELNESIYHLFPSHHISRGKLTGINLLNSGLAILSKLPIEQVEFYPFANSNILTSDYFCEKGVLLCKIKWKNKIVTIYNTHLQSANTCPYDPVALKQFTELLEIVNNSGPDNYVIGGDFNVEYKKIISHFKLFNVFHPVKPTIYINYVTSNSIPYAKPNYTGLVYDYFISDFELAKPKTIKTLYSDHLPVHTKLL
jgi:endonuclease/exonuclease/phosphatase family metal-dependent hydrolase